MKESKSIISLENCKKGLLFNARAVVLINAILLAVLAPICIPFLFFGISISKHIVLLAVIFAVTLSVPPMVFVVKLAMSIIELCRLKNIDLVIVKDEVCRISRGEREGRGTVDVLYFARYGRAAPSSAQLALTELGDEYYLVITEGEKPKIVACYHTKMYEIK